MGIGLAREDAPDFRHEGLDRHCIVGGVEGYLIPSCAEVGARREMRMASVFFPSIPVATDVMPIVIALEDVVMGEDPMSPLADIGTQ